MRRLRRRVDRDTSPQNARRVGHINVESITRVGSAECVFGYALCKQATGFTG